MAQINHIKDLYENEDLSLREISRKTGHSFKTVQKYAYQSDWSEDNLPNTEPQGYPVLGDFIPVIDEWLEDDRKIPRKQRHTVWRIFCRLRDEHSFSGSYSSVKRYVRKRRFVMNSPNGGYLPLEHALGSGQVDFGEHIYYDGAGQQQNGYALTISFPNSNKGYTQTYPSQNQECLLEGMKRVFEHIGGVPPRLRFDNMSTAVVQCLRAPSEFLRTVSFDLCCITVFRRSFAILLPAMKKEMWRTRWATAAEMPLSRFRPLPHLRISMNPCGSGVKRMLSVPTTRKRN